MLETLYSNGSTVVRFDPSTQTAETTDRGRLPTLDEIARKRARDRYLGPESEAF